MSQTGITDPARETELDAWYIEHLRIMLTVPGIHSTQRFKTKNTGHPPSLAMYSVDSAAVFQDPYYLSVRGMGEWLPLIDRKHYRRNLFEGLAAAPAVSGDCVLLVADRPAAEGPADGVDFIWLKTVGLDRSTPYRGIAVIRRDAAERFDTADSRFAVYAPVTPYNRKD